MSSTKAARDRTATTIWLPGPRFHPQVRAALKARAALAGMTLENELHVILCAALDRTDLADEKPHTKHKAACS